MDSNHRFNRDEISKILKRAAELEHEDDVQDDSEGLTMEELQQVSAEVGLHPKYIHLALEERQNPVHSTSSNILGGPFTYSISDSANGVLAEEDWEDIVTEIRRIHGGIGKTSKLGNTFEWEQRKREVGYIQISLSPKKDHTKINLNASYNYFASILYGLVGMLGSTFTGVLISILFKKAGLPITPLLIAGGLGFLGLMSGVRFYLSSWMKKKRKTYNQLLGRFKEMLAPDSGNKEIDTTSSIIIDTDDQKNQAKESGGRRQKEQTK